MTREVEIPFTIRFITPAVLKEVDHAGGCSAPPFERLLRRWWRCVEMGRSRKLGAELDSQELGRREASFFGSLHGDPTQPSTVEIIFGETDSPILKWAEGTSKKTPALREPEEDEEVDVDRKAVDGMMRSLGLVPLDSFRSEIEKREKAREKEIEAGETLRTVIRCPEERREEIESTLGLIHWLGAMENPYRNGLGSLDILREDGQPWCSRSLAGLEPIEKPWTKCLDIAWPHALGTEATGDGGADRPLLWRTKRGEDDWLDCTMALDGKDPIRMILLAMRKADGTSTDGEAREDNWQRLYKSLLRFKVIEDQLDGEDEPKYYGIAYHMPHTLSSETHNAPQDGTALPTDVRQVLADFYTEMDVRMHRWTSP